MIYWDSWIFTCLLINLSITKQISDRNIMLAYFGYFLDYLRPGLFGIKDTEVKSTYVRITCYGDAVML